MQALQSTSTFIRRVRSDSLDSMPVAQPGRARLAAARRNPEPRPEPEGFQAALLRATRHQRERVVDTHEHLFLQGARQTQVHLVRSGVISIYRLLIDGRRHITRFAYPGDFIGLECSELHVDSAEALSPARVRSVSVGDIETLMTSEAGFGYALLIFTARELAENRERLLSLGRRSAVERLAMFLLRIARRSESMGEQASVLQLPMKRSEIADFLGLTIETVSRNMSRLKAADVIHLRSCTHIEILDRDRLQAIAYGGDTTLLP